MIRWFWKEYFHSSKMKRRPSPFVARQMQTNVSSFLGKVASGCKSWLRSFLTIHHLYRKRSCNTNLRPFDQKLKGFPARTTSILTYFTGLWLVQIQNIWPFALTKGLAQNIWLLFWPTLTKCLSKISKFILSWHMWLAIRQKYTIISERIKLSEVKSITEDQLKKLKIRLRRILSVDYTA